MKQVILFIIFLIISSVIFIHHRSPALCVLSAAKLCQSLRSVWIRAPRTTHVECCRTPPTRSGTLGSSRFWPPVTRQCFSAKSRKITRRFFIKRIMVYTRIVSYYLEFVEMVFDIGTASHLSARRRCYDLYL